MNFHYYTSDNLRDKICKFWVAVFSFWDSILPCIWCSLNYLRTMHSHHCKIDTFYPGRKILTCTFSNHLRCGMFYSLLCIFSIHAGCQWNILRDNLYTVLRLHRKSNCCTCCCKVDMLLRLFWMNLMNILSSLQLHHFTSISHSFGSFHYREHIGFILDRVFTDNGRCFTGA